MSENFPLAAVLAKDCVNLGALDLSLVLLKSDSEFPWLILVPQRPHLVELCDLNDTDAALLTHEIRLVAQGLQNFLAASAQGRPSKMNIAALGNQVRQLHIHIIARYQTDSAWPNPIWSLGKYQAAYAAAPDMPNPQANHWQTSLAEQAARKFFASLTARQ
ncbi:MAG: HIT domain-containing protein [Alphaproteobacteria bacterium]|nr:HIT domain-containing protein [Alphaproteobacteria bacterium]